MAAAEDVRKLRGQGSASLEARRQTRSPIGGQQNDNLPGLLPLYPGQFLMLRDNEAVEVGLANGSVGIRKPSSLTQQTRFRLHWSRINLFHEETSCLPAGAFQKLSSFQDRCAHPSPLKQPLASSFAALGNLEEGVIPSCLNKRRSAGPSTTRPTPNGKFAASSFPLPPPPASQHTLHKA